jgi:hypothetical protein
LELVGTKTLMFDTDKRFPMATKFTARIPAGTKSATGQLLQKDFVWTFTTPPPKVETMIPNGQTVRRDALMYVRFDQAISPEAVLKTISVTGGGRKLTTRLATQEEIASDAAIAYDAKQAQPGRWIAFRAVNTDGSTINALPGASYISATVETGTPSAEGPLKTQKPQSFGFNTFGPFKYNKAYCGWENNKNCSPFETWYMEFNNSIDASKFTKEMVKIEPAVEGLQFSRPGIISIFKGTKREGHPTRSPSTADSQTFSAKPRSSCNRIDQGRRRRTELLRTGRSDDRPRSHVKTYILDLHDKP